MNRETPMVTIWIDCHEPATQDGYYLTRWRYRQSSHRGWIYEDSYRSGTCHLTPGSVMQVTHDTVTMLHCEYQRSRDCIMRMELEPTLHPLGWPFGEAGIDFPTKPK